ncbi:MAG TPA: cell division protein ZipA C-terminal FtsZ-binding domain-containing protein, partial [Halioglobus sp.]
MTIRDWMVIVGVLLIMAVLLDAWRRIRRDKNAKVRMKLVDPEELPPPPVEDISWFGELPNGGARVVERGDILRAAGFGQGGAKTNITGSPSAKGAGRNGTGNKETGKKAPGKRSPGNEDGLVTGITSVAPGDEAENLDWLDGLVSDESQPKTAVTAPTAGTLPRYEEPEVFMLNVVARNPQGFRGDDILHILLACDLRFGDMNFFHRHEFEAGRGAIQFSVANMMQPGVFDIDNMADMSTPGLVFFLTLPGPEDMMKA